MNNKLSNEDLKRIIQECQNLLHGCCITDGSEIVDIQDALSMARELLAYREAESKPVAWSLTYTQKDNPNNKHYSSCSAGAAGIL